MGLRPRQDEDDERKHHTTQEHRGVDEAHSPALRRILIGVGVAHTQCRLISLAVKEIPQDVRDEQQQQ